MLSTSKLRRFILSTIGLLSVLYPLNATAHSTPAELAELSLEELFAYTIDGDTKTPQRWSFTYNYNRKKIDGYNDGSNKLSLADVLFSPGETRTSKNFPVVPTTIIQEAHVFQLGYAVSQKTSFYISVPYIKQSSDHISSVANYSGFNISSEGVGDINVAVNQQIYRKDKHTVSLSASLSLPTGSTDEEGDTPRGPGDQQLPYTMQLGTGTYDLGLTLMYKNQAKHPWKSYLSAKIRTGKNDRSYRLGNNYTLGVSQYYSFFEFAQPYIGAEYSHVDSINGLDRELTVLNPLFPFPASITNPDFYGGQTVKAKIGLAVPVKILNTDNTLTVEAGYPLYQNLNGIQPRERLNVSIKFNISL